MPPSSAPAIVIDAGIGVCTVTDAPLNESARAAWASWQAQGQEIYAPSLWRSEVTSALHKLFRLKQLTQTEAEAALDIALALDVQIVEADDDLCRQSFRWATRLQATAAYDGFYLALAERLGAEFWTTDERLTRNAHQVGADWVHWLGEVEQVK